MTADTIDGRCPFSRLTPREREVMSHIIAGMPNKRISASLGISLRTVELHRTRIFRKLGLRNAVELTNYVWQNRPYLSPELARQLARQFSAGSLANSSMGSRSG